MLKVILGLICFVQVSIIDVAWADDLQTDLQTILDQKISSSMRTPGACLSVSIPGKETITIASGHIAKSRDSRNVSVSDTFRLASISKTYLAAALLKLSRNRPDILKAKLRDVLPNYIRVKRLPNGGRLRVDHLLAMRSGIPDYLESSGFEELSERDPHYPLGATKAVSFLYGAKALFPPGMEFDYSNTNYVILGILLSHITKKSFISAMKQVVFEPLNLSHTMVERSTREEVVSPHLTTRGYELDENRRLVDVTDVNDGLGLGDGGIISTSSEVNSFVRALFLEGKFLNRALLKTMTSFGEDDYGYGVEYEYTAWGRAYQHNGTSSGFQGQYYVFPDSGISWVLLTNSLDSNIIESTLVASMNRVTQDL